ncbi:hypothetical protein RRG08_002070 [Elysia crispata]|uniref:Uncharacterized protein n=1 Tax=Elysia crispata TaxID=231223 RepID=A0AAE0ZLC9_9GAST|nr:hypothetical protein RRG08_002070 [Elysia crispata]
METKKNDKWRKKPLLLFLQTYVPVLRPEITPVQEKIPEHFHCQCNALSAESCGSPHTDMTTIRRLMKTQSTRDCHLKGNINVLHVSLNCPSPEDGRKRSSVSDGWIVNTSRIDENRWLNCDINLWQQRGGMTAAQSEDCQ